MDSLPAGSMQLWLAVVTSILGPLAALIVGFVGADHFLRWKLGEKRQQAACEGAGGGEIGPVRRAGGSPNERSSAGRIVDRGSHRRLRHCDGDGDRGGDANRPADEYRSLCAPQRHRDRRYGLGRAPTAINRLWWKV